MRAWALLTCLIQNQSLGGSKQQAPQHARNCGGSGATCHFLEPMPTNHQAPLQKQREPEMSFKGYFTEKSAILISAPVRSLLEVKSFQLRAGVRVFEARGCRPCSVQTRWRYQTSRSQNTGKVAAQNLLNLYSAPAISSNTNSNC